MRKQLLKAIATIPVVVVSLLTGGAALAQQQGPPLQPLPHPELPEIPPTPAEVAPWVIVFSSVVGLILLAVLLWLLLKPRPPKAVLPANSRKEALKALKALKEVHSELSPPEVGNRVSAVFRQYLHQRYQIPAPFKSTQELFATPPRRTTPPPLPPRDKLYEFANRKPAPLTVPQHFAPLAAFWDRLSFAPLPATTEDAGQLIESAIQRIEEDPA